MYGREAFAIVNPYRISEIENYPVLEKYFDGRFNENFGSPQNHFSPFLAATYMGFEPAGVSICAATIYDKILASSLASEAGLIEIATNQDGAVEPAPDKIVLLEEQLPQIKQFLQLDEKSRNCVS